MVHWSPPSPPTPSCGLFSLPRTSLASRASSTRSMPRRWTHMGWPQCVPGAATRRLCTTWSRIHSHGACTCSAASVPPPATTTNPIPSTRQLYRTEMAGELATGASVPVYFSSRWKLGEWLVWDQFRQNRRPRFGQDPSVPNGQVDRFSRCRLQKVDPRASCPAPGPLYRKRVSCMPFRFTWR